MASAPVDSAPNPRAAIGGNNPPLEERTIMEFDANLREHDGLFDRIDAYVKHAAAAGPCLSDDDAGRYGDFVRQTASTCKVIDDEREILNRPLLTAQRQLKSRADSYRERAATAGAYVRGLLDVYLAEKERKRRTEELRLADIALAEAAERQRVIDEANARARAEAEAERARLQAIEDKRAALERARLQAIEDERAAAEAREVKVIVVEAKVHEVGQVIDLKPDFEPVFVKAEARAGPIRGDYGSNVSVTENWHVEVVNIRQVPDIFLKNPAVTEALGKVLGPMVRSKTGLREIKGCRIWSTAKSSIR